MQDTLEKIYRSFAEFFSGLELSRKIGLIAISVFILAGSASIMIWASKTRFEPLHTNLNKEDVQRLSVMLEEGKIPFQLADNGKTIKIPTDRINEWRLKIAMRGVKLSGSLGYEVFDKQSFGTSSFVQKINKQRALEGELIRTITYIRGVKRARVHLTIPESSPFVSEKKAPTASVILDMQEGSSITTAEVKGISSLISSSVEGMRPESVVILDSRGKKLSDNNGDAMTVYTANRIALENKLNRKYEGQIEEILTKVVGAGKVIAKVDLKFDYTESYSTERSYDQENSAVVSEVKNSSNLRGSRPSPQGLPGARSNIPGEKPQPGIPETSNNVKKELVTKNYNVPTKVTKSKRPSASIKSLSAAVMIDSKRVGAVDESGKAILGKDGKQIMKTEKWSSAEIANFSAIVASTIGLDTKRGDKIVIRNMEFAQEDMSVAETYMRERENKELIKSIVKYLAVGLTISLFFFLVVRPFIQWITDNTVETVEDFLPKTLEELEKVQANQKLPGLEDALPQIEEKLNPEKIEGNMLREKIISLVENNPAKAAQVLHDMVHEKVNDKQIA